MYIGLHFQLHLYLHTRVCIRTALKYEGRCGGFWSGGSFNITGSKVQILCEQEAFPEMPWLFMSLCAVKPAV